MASSPRSRAGQHPQQGGAHGDDLAWEARMAANSPGRRAGAADSIGGAPHGAAEEEAPDGQETSRTATHLDGGPRLPLPAMGSGSRAEPPLLVLGHHMDARRARWREAGAPSMDGGCRHRARWREVGGGALGRGRPAVEGGRSWRTRWRQADGGALGRECGGASRGGAR